MRLLLLLLLGFFALLARLLFFSLHLLLGLFAFDLVAVVAGAKDLGLLNVRQPLLWITLVYEWLLLELIGGSLRSV